MKKTILILTISIGMLISCTDNQRARSFGGNETIELKPNHKFINIAWKSDDLWVVTQDTITGMFYCKEKSSWGLLSGEIKIKNK